MITQKNTTALSGTPIKYVLLLEMKDTWETSNEQSKLAVASFHGNSRTKVGYQFRNGIWAIRHHCLQDEI